MNQGNPYGTHRVLEPKGVLPQPALRVDNDFSKEYRNEILVDVDILNVDSASFTQIKREEHGDAAKIADHIKGIVAKAGKLKNPVTGSGGMFIGRVAKIGPDLEGTIDLKVGDKIASLVSLSLTPLRIDEVKEVRVDVDQVAIQGQAVLFERSLYAKLPEDMPESLALAVLDVAGAAAQVSRLAEEGQTVAIIGAGGKSGILCAYEAKKRVGVGGRIIALCHSERGAQRVRDLGIAHDILVADATDAVGCLNAIEDVTGGRLCDLTINCVNVEDTEMASILITRDRGTVYFFSMATSFTKAALGAEGIGKDVTMLIGNGYAEGHAEHAIGLLRESPEIRELYAERYAGGARA